MPKYRVPFSKGARMSSYISIKSQKSVNAWPRCVVHRRDTPVCGRKSWAQKEDAVKHPLALLTLCAALLLSLPARAADIDWKKVDVALGKTAAASEPTAAKLVKSVTR